MANNKSQHFVPKFYFKFFSQDKKRINLLYLKKGNVLIDIPIKEQCAEDNFYGDKAVEATFSDLETVLADALKLCHVIKSVKELDSDKCLMIMEAVYFQKSRTLAERERANPFHEKHMQYHVEVSLNKDRKLSDVEKAEIRQGLKYFKPNPHFVHNAEIQTSLLAAIGLSDMGLYILENKTDTPFVFSDAPAIFFNQYYEKVRDTGVLGCQSPGLQIFYPISPSRCVMFIDEKKYLVRGDDTKIIPITSEDVSHLNKMQIHNAHQVVYFHDESCADYLKEVWNYERKHKGPNNLIVNMAHSVSEQRSILHSYAPLLSYSPRFSFLSYTPAEESATIEVFRSRKWVAEVNRLMDKHDRLTEKTLRRIKMLRPFTFVMACFSVAMNRLCGLLIRKQDSNSNSRHKAI